MNRYELLSGEVVEYDTLPAPLAAFLTRVQSAASDLAVSPAALLALVYGVENPLLDTTTAPGRAIVNATAFAHPVYKVLGDLVGRKQLAALNQSPEQVVAAYTLTVKAAAERIGLSETATRTAIQGGKLDAMKRNGEWYVRPESVDSYKVSNRGRKKAVPAAVRVRCGGADGVSLSVRLAGGELVAEGKDGGAVVGRFPDGWTAAAVKTTTKTGARVFEIEPEAGTEEVVEFGEFEVRGPFKVVKKHNATKVAAEVWKKYAAEA